MLIRYAAVALGVVVALAGCTGEGDGGSTDPRAAHVGGTLELTMFAEDFSSGEHAVTFDPALETTPQGVELLRCCLVRTLMTYDAREGGGSLVPDLAAAPPAVAQDGLTWTFRLRAGLTYAPPLDDVPITSHDFVRALTRAATQPPGVRMSSYFRPIAGYQEARDGGASTITGLATPNDRTLEIHLSEPTGDLADRLALPAASPLPAQGAALLAADPHLDYGEFLVSSGPYMFAGAPKERLDPAVAEPAVDLSTPSSITLVRNASWGPSLDPTRSAYVDRIHITVGGDADANAALVDEGRADLQLEGGTSTPRSILHRYAGDPDLQDRLVGWDQASIWAVAMNLAVPPFDDPHVRRAVAYAMNTDDLVKDVLTWPGSMGTISTGRVARHIAPDATEGDLLTGFDPFPGHLGQERRAKAWLEMTRSGYETDRDGRCIDPICEDVAIYVDGSDASLHVAQTLHDDLHPMGIELAEPIPVNGSAIPARIRAPLFVTQTWVADYPNASTLFVPLLSGDAIHAVTNRNLSMLGATAATLQRFGYDVTSVATIDARIDACLPLAGDEQTACWALLDKYVMLEIVPWVPFFTGTYSAIVSSRLHDVRPDPLSQIPALDQVWLDPPTSSSPS
ncbi:MAG TPA: ABC transporter substrate-binding protein [Actinomycetota bacterium]